MNLSPEDRATVEYTVEHLSVDQYDQIIGIHRDMIRENRARLTALKSEIHAIERANELRRYAIDLLRSRVDGAA